LDGRNTLTEPKTKKKKRGFLDYETYEGPRGSAAEWRGTFFDRMGFDKAVEILGSDDPMVVFGLKGDATWSDVVKMYRKLAVKYHPDKGGDVEAMKKVNAAYEVLEARFKK
jgi:hypothetical protein